MSKSAPDTNVTIQSDRNLKALEIPTQQCKQTDF